MKILQAAVVSSILVLSASASAAPATADPDPAAPKLRECKVLPRDKRVLKLDLKPDSRLLDVLNMYSLVTCKKLNASGDLSKHRASFGKMELITVEELSGLMRAAAQKAGVKLDETETSIDVSATR